MMSSIIDYTDRATCIIFGDGGGAVLLEPDDSGNGIIDSVLHVDGAGREFLHMKAGGSLKPPTHETIDRKEHFVFQDGKPVFKAAINGMVDTIQDIVKRNHLSLEDINWLVPHQANIRIINGVAEMLDFLRKKL